MNFVSYPSWKIVAALIVFAAIVGLSSSFMTALFMSGGVKPLPSVLAGFTVSIAIGAISATIAKLPKQQ